jgi:hypothetical protein
MGKPEGKIECDKPAVRVADKNELVDAERPRQCIAIGAQALEGQFVIAGWPVRSALPQLVVANDLGVLGKRIDERTEVLVVQAQATVQEDNRNSFSEAHVIEVFSVHGNESGRLGPEGG